MLPRRFLPTPQAQRYAALARIRVRPGLWCPYPEVHLEGLAGPPGEPEMMVCHTSKG